MSFGARIEAKSSESTDHLKVSARDAPKLKVNVCPSLDQMMRQNKESQKSKELVEVNVQLGHLFADDNQARKGEMKATKLKRGNSNAREALLKHKSRKEIQQG